MSTSTPPPPEQQQPPTQSYQRPYYGSPWPPMPMPNGELVVFLGVWFVVLIVTLATDDVGWGEFVIASVVLAFGYMLSRGIAKASRVFEGR